MHQKAKQQEEGDQDQVLGGEVFRSHTLWNPPDMRESREMLSIGSRVPSCKHLQGPDL